MKQNVDRIKSSSKVAIVALSFGAFWCILLLLDGIGKLAAHMASTDTWTALSYGGYRPLPYLLQLALLLAIVSICIAMLATVRKRGTPFVASIPRRMKLIAILVFILSSAPNWVYYLLRGIHEGETGFAIIENSGIIGLILAAVVYALAMIFQYGCQLQQEIDETL